MGMEINEYNSKLWDCIDLDPHTELLLSDKSQSIPMIERQGLVEIIPSNSSQPLRLDLSKLVYDQNMGNKYMITLPILHTHQQVRLTSLNHFDLELITITQLR